MAAVVAEQEGVPEPFCNDQFSESGLGTGSLAEGRVFFCRESLHYTDVLFMLRFDGTLDSILNTFKRICSMELKPSLMSSGASSLLSSALFSVISDSECKVLEDETGSGSAFDYLWLLRQAHIPVPCCHQEDTSNSIQELYKRVYI